MSKHNIVRLPGDGIGKVVDTSDIGTAEAVVVVPHVLTLPVFFDNFF